MTKNIYLIGMKINVTPDGFIVCSYDFFYNHNSPSGLKKHGRLYLGFNLQKFHLPSQGYTEFLFHCDEHIIQHIKIKFSLFS